MDEIYNDDKLKIVKHSSGDVVVFFNTEMGTITTSFEYEQVYGSDSISVGLLPKKYPTDYIDLFYGHVMQPEDAKRVGADKSAIGLYLYEDPSTEDSTHFAALTDAEINAAIKEYYDGYGATPCEGCCEGCTMCEGENHDKCEL